MTSQRQRSCYLSTTVTSACAASIFCAMSALAFDCNSGTANTFKVGGRQYCHVGGGRFLEITGTSIRAAKKQPRLIDLRKVQHSHDRKSDPDVPIYTDISLPGVTPDLVDRSGREYAIITLYNIDPPLEDLPSQEAGVDRGIDFRDPSNLVRSAYSNYVSPVLTNDRERKTVPGHPIGHFYVKVEIPGYPAILTGMTTTARADTELVDLTLGRQLGIGGVLLTPQPGRLNTAAEATEELRLRQRELVVIDGLYYQIRNGRNIGPTYLIKDGNVVFARFRLPRKNVIDGLRAFIHFIDNGAHNIFGSLLSRPSRGDGAGCSAFAMSWLKAAGVIPFVDEAQIPADWKPALQHKNEDAPLWMHFYNRIRIPWDHIGCDNRVGLHDVPPRVAAYTVYDNLFHNVSKDLIALATQGLAEKIRKTQGQIAGTLFRYGALTPLRDFVISSKRKDPRDRGDYSWASSSRRGLVVGFWDNSRFSDWIKNLWASPRKTTITRTDGTTVRLVKEGRFLGVEIDALATPRVHLDSFAAMPDRALTLKRLSSSKTCRSVFSAPAPR